MRQVRHRLASCQTVPVGEVASELPGGIWKVSPTRDVSKIASSSQFVTQHISRNTIIGFYPIHLYDNLFFPTGQKPVSRFTRRTGEEEEEEEDEEEDDENDIPLTGQHDCPLVQQNMHPYEGQGNKTVTFDTSPVRPSAS